MIRVLVLMGGLIASGIFFIAVAAICTRPRKVKQPKVNVKAIQKENVELIQLVRSLDNAAEAEYAVHSNNIFAATVRDTIERANVRSLT